MYRFVYMPEVNFRFGRFWFEFLLRSGQMDNNSILFILVYRLCVSEPKKSFYPILYS